MKKIIILSTLLAGVSVLSGCSTKEKLYILNWGEYISEDLVEEFEDEFNVKVVSRELVSNELMYAELERGESYDVVFPSDYMVEKLSKEDLIIQLDKELLPSLTNVSYTQGLDDLIDKCGYDEYFVPYFWGSLGIMYNEGKDGISDDVEEYGWGVLFDENMLSKYNVGMYASSRDSFAAASLHLGKSINNYDTTILEECSKLLSEASYKAWGDDDLKGKVASGNLDIALVYSGDFFDQLYADDYEDINYNIFAPDTNNIFFDAMCIPSNSQNKELAHSFINFMATHENSVENSFEVGYCPTIQSVFNTVSADDEMKDIVAYSAWNPQNISNGEVYKDLGLTIYTKMEELYNSLRTG